MYVYPLHSPTYGTGLCGMLPLLFNGYFVEVAKMTHNYSLFLLFTLDFAKCCYLLTLFPCTGLTGCVYGFEEDGRTSTGNQYTGGVNVASCEGNICRFSLCSNGALCVLDSGDAKGYTCNCTEVGRHDIVIPVMYVVRWHVC